MESRDTYRNTLVHACMIEGGEYALAKRLRIPMASLATYLVGDVPIPTDVFLKAVDIVLDSQVKRIADSPAKLDTLLQRLKK